MIVTRLRYSILRINGFNYSTKKAINMMDIKTFAFLDLETTGLPQLENNRTKITELCIVTVQADHIELGCFPRVSNRLSFCFNPGRIISSGAEEITGLSNEILQYQTRFSLDTATLINTFLDQCRKPVCLVAHNGNRFDFPIFQTELQLQSMSLPADVLCLDSLETFREIDHDTANKNPNKTTESSLPFEMQPSFNTWLCAAIDDLDRTMAVEKCERQLSAEEVQRINETTPTKRTPPQRENSVKKPTSARISRPNMSYKLKDVYTRLTGKNPVDEHQAAGDVQMMIYCAAMYAEKFINFANKCAKPFCDIPKMVPGGNCIRK